MPIAQSDIEYRLSGGAGNADPNAALGGAMSDVLISDGVLHNLFDAVSGQESAAGDVEYRCLYVLNNHGTLTWQQVKAWIAAQTDSPDTAVAIGLDPAGVGDGSATGVATTIADESAAPAGVGFTQPTDAAPLAVGDIPPGQAIAVWVRRTVNAGAAAFNADTAQLRAEGDTAA